MWLVLAFGSAFFAGVTSILAKIGIKDTDSHLCTALRTVVVLVFSWLMVFLVGSQHTITDISKSTMLYLCLSGVTTGASWLCYFKALQMGEINKVVPVDKSSMILTILLGVIFLKEDMNVWKAVCVIAIAVGTYLMIEKKKEKEDKKGGKAWFVYAVLSAVFASLTALLSKIGIVGVESNLGTAIRTIVVLIMAWLIVFVTHKQSQIKHIDKKSWLFIFLSGIATGLSWLCYYSALQDGPISVILPIDKLSILVTVLFAYLVFKETLSKKSVLGLICIVAGTLGMLF